MQNIKCSGYISTSEGEVVKRRNFYSRSSNFSRFGTSGTQGMHHSDGEDIVFIFHFRILHLFRSIQCLSVLRLAPADIMLQMRLVPNMMRRICRSDLRCQRLDLQGMATKCTKIHNLRAVIVALIKPFVW